MVAAILGRLWRSQTTLGGPAIFNLCDALAVTRRKWLTKRRVVEAVVVVALVALLEVAREFLPTDGWGHPARQGIGWLMSALTVLWLLALVVLSVSEFWKGLNEEKATM